MTDRPQVPPLFRVVAVATPAQVSATALDIARRGGGDGTLVWVPPCREGRPGPHAGEIDCALVLEPGVSLGKAVQLGYAGVLGLVEALGAMLPPLARLTYRWPATVALNGARLATVELICPRTERDETVAWLVLRLAMCVAGKPPEEGSTSLHREGYTDLVVEDVLGGFARHFVSWTNRWLDDGFGPLRSAWLKRVEGRGETITVAAAPEDLSGTFVDLDDEGRLVLESDGARRTVGLWETPVVKALASS